MKFLHDLYRSLSLILPKPIYQAFEHKAAYAGSKHWQKVVGISFLIGFFVAIAILVVAFYFEWLVWQQYLIMSLGILSFPGGYFAAYLFLYFKADKRTTQIEALLPDALQMIASNLRAGNTAFDSAKQVATEEFGPLGEEFERVISASVGNVSFSDMLLTITKRVDSASLQRSLSLFASSLRSGGHLAPLLEGLAEDITDRQSLKKDLVTSTRTNTMFIMFTIIIGTPLLLAISVYFVDTVTALQATTGGGGSGALAGFGGEITIDSVFLIRFSYIILFVTGLLACMFIGSMIDGDSKKGLKLAPIVVLASYAVFVLSRFAVVYFLGAPG